MQILEIFVYIYYLFAVILRQLRMTKLIKQDDFYIKLKWKMLFVCVYLYIKFPQLNNIEYFYMLILYTKFNRELL